MRRGAETGAGGRRWRGRRYWPAALRRRPDGFTWALLALAALGAAHLLVRTAAYGLAIDPDSVTYLSTAANLAAGHGLRDFRGEGLLPAPPGYPLLLAAITMAGVELLEAARWLNAAALGLIILLSGYFLRRQLHSPVIAAGGALTVAVSAPLVAIASTALTETVLILFTLLALLLLGRFLNRPGSWRLLLLAAGLAALAGLTRHLGNSVIVAGVILLLLYGGAPLLARLKYAAVFGAAAAILVAAVFLRNWLLFGELDRETHRLGRPLPDSLNDIRQNLEAATLPTGAPDWWAWLLWAALIAGLLAAGAVWRRSAGPPTGGPAGRDGLGQPVALGGYALAFPVFLLAVMLWVGSSDGILGRYIVPMYAPALLFAIFLFDRFVRLPALGRWRAVKRGLTAAALAGGVLWFGYGLQSDIRRTVQALDYGYTGQSYNTPYWDDSATIQYLRGQSLDGIAFSNRYGLLHYLLAIEAGVAGSGRYPTLPNRADGLYASLAAKGVALAGPRRAGEPAALADDASPVYLVWFFDDGEPTYSYDYAVADLPDLLRLEPVAELPDSRIFRMKRQGEP